MSQNGYGDICTQPGRPLKNTGVGGFKQTSRFRPGPGLERRQEGKKEKGLELPGRGGCLTAKPPESPPHNFDKVGDLQEMYDVVFLKFLVQFTPSHLKWWV